MRKTRPKSPRPKAETYHHGDLRSALLEAAAELLAEKGVAGLSLRECARLVGVSHAAPYRHFESKEALVSALAAQGFRWLREAGEAAMAEHDEPRDRLDAYGVAYVRFAIEQPQHFKLMFTSEFEPACEEDEFEGRAAYDLLRDAAVAVKGAENGDLAAAAFWSLPHGLSMLILDGRIPEELVQSADDAESLARAVMRQWRSD